MEDFEKWQDKINLAVNKYGRNRPLSDMEDLRQEIALALIQDEDFTKMLLILPEDTVGRYVFTFSKSRILNVYRKNRHHDGALSLTEPEVAEEAALLAGHPDDDAQTAALRKAIAKLPSIERFVVETLFFEEGATEESVAATLGWSKWQLRARKELVLKKLKNLL